ncbi:MAG: prepilin-type N-terminal cleavage/methylation domain-containing protein [Candidatus Accumulibacter sp.]|uniref:Prepilin-type N-terminal cleavage/methylation domain-containing protein n=1 Tax=Candidatus Accumulibacter affinis TaxID=2954384 RepID=A0A935T9W4_9PROT|nr:prepilin-type N-terminal cleavage/methylation domain-containing protein [Candidatus Accumulibacter affinis]
MKRQAGFTLIEVMIVVIIIGILTAIAVPSYTDYLVRSRITHATSGLAAWRVRMEQFFQDNHTYADADAEPAIDGCAITLPAAVDSSYFDFSCSNLTATTYLLTATGKSSMTGFIYTVTEGNAKKTTGVRTGWTTSDSCWVTSKGGGC